MGENGADNRRLYREVRDVEVEAAAKEDRWTAGASRKSGDNGLT